MQFNKETKPNVSIYLSINEESYHGVVVNVLDCNTDINEFELQFRYYVNFWINTLRWRYKLPYSYELWVK